MAVEGVIWDVSDTLLDNTKRPINGAVAAIRRLRALNIRIIAVSNDGSQTSVTRDLANAGITADLVLTRREVGAAKGSLEWIRQIKAFTNLATNQLIYVGDGRYDMITASNSHLIYFHAGWVNAGFGYGFMAPSPVWVAAVVEHIFRKRHLWWWELNVTDNEGQAVRKMALIDPSFKGVDEMTGSIYQDLLAVFKNANDNVFVGRIPLKEFILLHMVASVYLEGLSEQVGLWTAYPGHSPTSVSPMQNFLTISAKLFRRHYIPDLLSRTRIATKSNQASNHGNDIESATLNQLKSIRVDPVQRDTLQDQSVLVIDDFFTHGPTTEAGRNLLLKAGASEVIGVAVGKFGRVGNIINFSRANGSAWDPFNTIAQNDQITFDIQPGQGIYNPNAMQEFIASYRAMKAEVW